MITSQRLPLTPLVPTANRNIRNQYPLQQAQWIAHPDAHSGRSFFGEYYLDFSLKQNTEIQLHVSADQRFELYCDDGFIGMGPDRCDTERWSFHVYALTLGAGNHRLRAECHFFHDNWPHAQVFIRPAFILASPDAPVDLNTGSAPWQAVQRSGVTDRSNFTGEEYGTISIVCLDYERDPDATAFVFHHG